MAILHCPAKIISRGKGRSAVAAAAYRSGTIMINEYDGVVHDFTRKRGVVYSEIMLPDHAPKEFLDRSILWNNIELSEKADAQLAREWEISIPYELPKEEWIRFARDLIKELFVDQGMIADFAIHDKEHGNPNPHIHVMLTMRSIDRNGNWGTKTQQVYLCKNEAGEERGFTKEELALPENKEWQKQHHYSKNGDPKSKKIYLSKYEVENNPKYKDYKRIKNDRQPKTEKFGRKKQATEKWDSKEFLLDVRKGIADRINIELERMGYDQRVDHRSLKDQGIDRIPTIHEGVAARAMERKGQVSDRCEINRAIKESNREIMSLDAALDSVKQDMEEQMNINLIWDENIRRLQSLEKQGKDITKDVGIIDDLFEKELIPVLYVDEQNRLRITYFRDINKAMDLMEKTKDQIMVLTKPQPQRSKADRLRDVYEALKEAKGEMDSLGYAINRCKFWEKDKKEQLQSEWAIAMEKTRKALAEIFGYGVSQYHDGVKIDVYNVEPEKMKYNVEYHINRIRQEELHKARLEERGSITKEDIQRYREEGSRQQSRTESKEEKRKNKNKGIGD